MNASLDGKQAKKRLLDGQMWITVYTQDGNVFFLFCADMYAAESTIRALRAAGNRCDLKSYDPRANSGRGGYSEVRI
jgi:hypothetical protein